MIRNLPAMLLPTTVVGSYPAVIRRGLSSLVDPLRGAMKNAVDDQVQAGIDIISDGQVRGDMVQAFTARLPGIRGSEVIGKVLPASGPITVADTRYALSRSPFVKGIITGPTTLSRALHLSTPMYRNREELAMDLALALAVEASALQSAGVHIQQIDEPILSTGIADMAAAGAALSLICQKIEIPVCIHICGDLGGIIDSLASLQADILDFEFAKNRQNLDLFSGRDLKGRMIGFGCVDSSSAEVEPVHTIKERIYEGIEVFGPENMLIDPDCGLRMLSREIAFKKLSHMVSAVREVRAELCSP